MGFGYFKFPSYWKNLTSPMTCWHRGTAFQFEVMKDHPQRQLVLTDLGTDVVLVTMAARIVQSMISLGRSLLQKRALDWTMHPRACMSKVLRAAVWVCWSLMDLLLPLLMTTVYKNQSRFRAVCDPEQPMNTVTIKCHWGSRAEPEEKMVVEEFCDLKMETVQEIAKMEVACQCEQMARMNGMVDKEVLPSCMNPVILSMICVPSEQADSSESDMGSVEDLDGSQEDMSVDSGVQESWTPKSMNDEESDWSDDDSWDEESNLSNEDEDLWASFCRSDDPYNPLSFSMPTKSPEQLKKEAPTKSLDTNKILGNLDCNKVLKIDCGTVTEKQKTKLSKKPVLSGYKSPHKCTKLEEEAGEEGDQCTKKVRFSPKVTVHPIITWSFAHRMARKGPWEEYARDRSRFQRRIAETEAAIGFCLDPPHREKIWARLQRKQN